MGYASDELKQFVAEERIGSDLKFGIEERLYSRVHRPRSIGSWLVLLIVIGGYLRNEMEIYET